VLTITRDMILPTTVTALPAPSLVRPQPWPDDPSSRRSAIPVPRAVSGRGRRHHRRTGSGRARYRDRRRQPLRSDRGGKSWFFYPIERLGGITGHRDTARGWMSRHGLRRARSCGGAGGLSAGVVSEKLTRGPLEYAALWQVAQRMTDRPLKFGAICAPALASMLWNEFYEDDKAMILDLCDIHERRAPRYDRRRLPADPGRGTAAPWPCPASGLHRCDLEFPHRGLQSPAHRCQCGDLVHTCWGNPNQQRVHWKVPSYSAPCRISCSSTATC